MVISYIQGGLGNQLFQYAAAVSLATKTNDNVFCDTFWYQMDHDTKRTFILDVFFPKLNILPKHKSKLLHSSTNNLEERLKKRILLPRLVQFYENSLSFNIEFDKLNGDVFLEGNFQSFKYHTNLPNDFFSQLLNIGEELQSNNLYSSILNSNSVSIHIRRGDYANHEKTNQIHGTLGLNYYLDAICLLESKMSGCQFFIFSDDIDFIREKFNDPKFILVSSHKNLSDKDEFLLMANCKHHIIANSSFSWWTAYANRDQSSKLVICPQNWFKNAPKGFIYNDLIPSNWLKLG